MQLTETRLSVVARERQEDLKSYSFESNQNLDVPHFP